MPVLSYDKDKHHVGLGPSGVGTYGFSIAGYSKQSQQYGGPQDYGGTNDLIGIPTLSRWTMDDFSGGDGQYVWGRDVAMFSSCQGILPSQFGRSLRTSPPVVYQAAKRLEIGTRTPLGSFSADGHIYHVFSNGVTMLTPATGDVNYYQANQGGQDYIKGFAFDKNRRVLFLSCQGVSAGTIEAWKLPSFSTPAVTSTGLLGGPAASGGSSHKHGRCAVIGDKLAVSIDDTVYALLVPVGDGNGYALPAGTDWHKVGRLPGKWVADVTYNNFVYILCANADDGTTLVYYDPGLDSIFTVCEFPYNFVGQSLAEYAGRVYVGGAGQDIGGNDKYAELHEVTGTTVRLVRTYAPESRSVSVSHPTGILSMAVYEGMLFYGNKGKCLSAYDVTRDSFFDGPALFEASGVQDFPSVTSFRGTLYLYLMHPDTSKIGYYRVAAAGDAMPPTTSSVVTSEFVPEPDRDKRFSELKVLTRYGTVTAGYSFVGGSPGGDTFTTLPVLSQDARGDNYLTTFDFSALPVSPNIRLRFQMQRTDPATFTELVAFTASFVMLETGKRAWNFTINATQYVEARDREPIVQNVHDIQSELWRYFTDRIPLDFIDVDGAEYKVSLTNVNEARPVIGPAVDLQAEQGLESLISVQLIEV
jgi:hypothetical protein